MDEKCKGCLFHFPICGDCKQFRYLEGLSRLDRKICSLGRNSKKCDLSPEALDIIEAVLAGEFSCDYCEEAILDDPCDGWTRCAITGQIHDPGERPCGLYKRVIKPDKPCPECGGSGCKPIGRPAIYGPCPTCGTGRKEVVENPEMVLVAVPPEVESLVGWRKVWGSTRFDISTDTVTFLPEPQVGPEAEMVWHWVRGEESSSQ